MAADRTCPKCGMPCEPAARFCEHCACELPEASPPPPEIKKTESESAPAFGPSRAPLGAESVGALEAAPPEMAAPPSRPPSRAPESGSADAPSSLRREAATQAMIVEKAPSQCSEFVVLYNIARPFVEGLIMPFQFRITPQVDGVEDLSIEIRHGDRKLTGVRLPEDLIRDAELAVDVPFSPWKELIGKVPFEIWIGYTFQGRPQRLLFRKTHTCFPRKERARNVLSQLKVELHNAVSAGHASDPTVNMKVEGLDRLVPRPDDPAEEIRLADLPEIWERVALSRVKYKPAEMERGPLESRPPPEAVRDRLMLISDSHRICIASGRLALCGRRAEDCRILCRLPWNGLPNDPVNPNLGISRRHATLELAGATWTVRDGYWDQQARAVVPSKRGAYLNGRPLDFRKSMELPANSPFVLTLGGPDPADPRTVAYEGRIVPDAACPAASECRARGQSSHVPTLTIRRRGASKEFFVVLNGGIPLREISPSLPEGCLCRSGSGFLLRGDDRCVWLEVGGSVRWGGKTWRVLEYQPEGL